MNRERLFQRLAQGALQNVTFRDMTRLVEGFGFRVLRVTGSHHLFAHSYVSRACDSAGYWGTSRFIFLRTYGRIFLCGQAAIRLPLNQALIQEGTCHATDGARRVVELPEERARDAPFCWQDCDASELLLE